MLTARHVRALEVFDRHAGTLRTNEALENGIHSTTLYDLRDRGIVDQISRGLFRLSSLPRLKDPLALVALRMPRGIICLVSALAHHGLTKTSPDVIHVALPSNAQVPKLRDLRVRVFWYSVGAYEHGVERVTVAGVPVRIYCAERTIADCLKYRNKIGHEFATEAMWAYLHRRRAQIPLLFDFVKMNRATSAERDCFAILGQR